MLVLLALTLSLVPAAGASRRTAAGPKGIIDALNQARAANGLPALADSRALAAAARAHAASMARRGYFAHDSADGTSFWRRIAAFYPVGGFARWQVGETCTGRGRARPRRASSPPGSVARSTATSCSATGRRSASGSSASRRRRESSAGRRR